MTIPSVSLPVGTNPATAAQIAADSSKAMNLDPQAFLKLMVAQLQYQDPTNPVDTSQFMSQTATLSQVQTMNTMASTLTALVTAQQGQSATSMIGKSVTYLDPTGARVSGVVRAAELTSAGATVMVGTASVPLANVVEVTEAPSSTPVP